MKWRMRSVGSWHALLYLVVLFSVPLECARADTRQRDYEPVVSIGHSDTVYGNAFSPDGKRVLSSGRDGMIKLWDTASGHLIRTFSGHSGPVESIAISPDGTQILSGGYDKTMRLWSAATGEILYSFDKFSQSVVSVAFAPDGKSALSGSDDRTLKLWDLASHRLLRSYVGHTSTVNSVAFSPDGQRILSGSKDGTLKIWNTSNGTLLRTIDVHSDGEAGIISVAYSDDGERLLSTGYDGNVGLWDAGSGELIRTFKGDWGEDRSAAIAPDGKRVATIVQGTLKLWDTETGELLQSLAGGKWAISFSPDGSSVLANVGTAMCLWDVLDGHLIRKFEGHGVAVSNVAYSRDGSKILSGSKGSVEVWDATNGRTLHRSHVDQILAFSPSASLVLSNSANSVDLLNVDNGQNIRSFGEAANSAAFSPDERFIASGGRNKLDLFDASTGQLVRSFEGQVGGVTAVAFSPDGKMLLSGSDDVTVDLWDIASGKLLHTFSEHSDTINALAFSADGTRIVSASSDNTLNLWNASDYRLLHTFEGHSSAVRSVAFSADGTKILSGGDDRTLRVWDAPTGKQLLVLRGHTDAIQSVAFSSNGTNAISGSDDGTTRVWDIRSGAQLAIMIAGSNSDWLSLSPDGFFVGSRRDTNMLSIVRGMEVTTVGQIYQSLLNPDLLQEALAGDPDNDVKQAAKVVDIGKVIDSGPAPLVEITSPVDATDTENDLVDIVANIMDRGSGIGRIEWRVNGITTATTSVPDWSRGQITLSQKVAIDPGLNSVEVIAYNKRNLLASLPASVTVTFNGRATAIAPKLYVLAIGINKYVDTGWVPPGKTRNLHFSPLRLAVSDAVAVANALNKAASGLYSEVHATLALDEEATAANLDAIVTKMASQITPRDTFVLFAASHGYSKNSRFYLIPQDYSGGPSPDALAIHAIDQFKLQDWIANRIKAKRALILLDTCESGALTNGYEHSRVDEPASEAAIGRLHESTGRPVLTAAAQGQYAHEGVITGTDERHGIFTWALLDALKNSDTNGDGYIELSELVAHVQKVVPAIAHGLARAVSDSKPTFGVQTPRFGSTGEDFLIVKRLQQ